MYENSSLSRLPIYVLYRKHQPFQFITTPQLTLFNNLPYY